MAFPSEGQLIGEVAVPNNQAIANDGYAAIEQAVEPYHIGNRTMSSALLAWFLTNAWRMDPEDVEDSICDGPGDKGIDGIAIDDDLEDITIFQSKYHTSSNKTQGDSDLKALVGAAEYFRSPETLHGLLDSSPNAELRQLLQRSTVVEKLVEGNYTVSLVFVTNADLDASGEDYVTTRQSLQPGLTVWDRRKNAEVAERTRRPELRPEQVHLTANSEPTHGTLTTTERIAVALIPASQLVMLPGIDDLTLFSRNVRLFVGRTRINQELRSTVRTSDEHRLFPAYHNGLTLLTEHFDIDANDITLDRVGVVNGCQSLLTLHANREYLTDELRLLVKIVEVPAESDVADKITYRSNNQNAVNLRDQRSGDPIMRDLQRDVDQNYHGSFALQIRVGEEIQATDILDNTTAAQLLMACYLKDPASAVRKIRLFDEDFRRIFNRSIDSHKLYLIDMISKAVDGVKDQLLAELRTSFASVRFTLCYLICMVLDLSEAGRQIQESPERWLPEQHDAVAASLAAIAADVVESVNFHVAEEEQEREDFDPKVEFKSRAGVSRVQLEVLRQSRRQAKRDATYLFQVTPANR